MQAVYKFMAVYKQATELDKERIMLETKVHDMEKESSHKAKGKVKLENEIKELKNLVEELKAYIVENDTCLDHLQKRSDELTSSLSKATDEAIKDKVSNVFTALLDKNYAVGFEDFYMDAIEAFHGVDFNSIKLPIAVESSLL